MKFAETWPPTSGKVSVRLVATAPSSDFVLRGNSILGSGLESLCKAFTKAGDGRGSSNGFNEVQPTDLAAPAIAEGVAVGSQLFWRTKFRPRRAARVDPLVTLRDEQQGRTYFLGEMN